MRIGAVEGGKKGVQVGIPAVLMRGGTSTGLYFDRADLPVDQSMRDQFLLAAMGSPDPRQIDGAGGANSLTSKVAIVGPSSARDVDVDYLFAQVLIDRAIVDLNPTCGNMLAGVGPFAIDRGMVEAADGETCVRIHMVNTGGLVEAVVQTPARRVRYDGDVAIDGVPGTGAPVRRCRDRRRAGNRRARHAQPDAMRRLEDRRHAAFGTTAGRD